MSRASSYLVNVCLNKRFVKVFNFACWNCRLHYPCRCMPCLCNLTSVLDVILNWRKLILVACQGEIWWSSWLMNTRWLNWTQPNLSPSSLFPWFNICEPHLTVTFQLYLTAKYGNFRLNISKLFCTGLKCKQYKFKTCIKMEQRACSMMDALYHYK